MVVSNIFRIFDYNKNLNMLNFKKKKKSKSVKETHSSYWLKGWENSGAVVDSMNVGDRKTHDLYKLASAKRAISNFVTIVTGQKIPVEFNVQGESYTDGKSVVIGTEVSNPEDFDVVVGLALHEGSHIKLTNFDTLKEILDHTDPSTIKKSVSLGVKGWAKIIKDLLNVVEDRRIDSFIFNQAPGYRNYYRAMYDRFFNSPIIDVGLISDSHREETLDSYMYRIINIHNKNTDLTALKGLQEIFNLINLKKIDRLKTTDMAYNVAKDIYDVILENIEIAQNQKSDKDKEQGEGEGDEQELTDEEFQDLLDSMDGEINPSGDPGEEGKGKPVKIKLTDKQKELLKKKIEKQKDFLDGKTTKSTLDSTSGSDLKEIDHSGSEMTHVAKDMENGYGSYKGINVIVVKKLTKSLMLSELFPIACKNYSGNLIPTYQREILEGFRIGKILGKKLQLRSESRTTVYNRQKIGKIDKRMISSLGFGNENVFEFSEIDQYKKANLHVSIDASGSMDGSKWSVTMTNVAALCKAVDMLSNLEIQVTFRTTNDEKPYVVLAYDSRVDKLIKVKQLFPSLDAYGYTPEGLCFEAIMKDFLPTDADTDSYFLNISDGEPYFYSHGFSYRGQRATKHTRSMVKKIELMGIKTLAYFISTRSSNMSSEFKQMYGKSAKNINVTNISQITKTMNELFMTK